MMCEEEDSSMDEDEDMPGLESVSSSEYVSDEESVCLSSDGEDDPIPSPPVPTNSPNYITAQKWLNQNRGDVLNQIQVITIHMLSPFLYGCSHQSDKWLGWCFKVGLLQSDVNYNTGALKDLELCAVYVLDKAIEWCKERVTKEGVSPENLAELLQLAEEVRPISKLPRAIYMARRRSVFISMLDSVKESTDGKTRSNKVEDPHFTETACLYVIAQTAEHVNDVIKENINIVKEHEDYCQTDAIKYDSQMTKGDELREQGRVKDCIGQYTTTVNLCPYNYRLYTSRAHCYITTNQHRAAMADGLRAIYLKPGWSKGHLRYIQGLDGCGMTVEATLARKRYAQLFPGQSNNEVPGLIAERPEPTPSDRSLFDEIMKMCKKASKSYQEKNLTNTTYWYEEVWQKIKKNSGWKRCMDPGECDRFLVSLHYIYGSALLGRNEFVSAETSIPHFESIMTDFTSIKFPAAYYGAGRAYTFLRQHSDAVAMAKLGLEMVTMSSHCPPLNYPGTDTVIEDSKRDFIEVKLRRLLQQCKIMAIPDAVCRYADCLAHNSSNRIWSNHLDYRGHVTLECHQDCSISYHPSCWRKKKTESEQNTDKDFLLTDCLTPDCTGLVNVVIVYDNKGAIKAKFEAPPEAISKRTALKKSLPTSSSSSSLGKKSEKTRRRKNTEKDNDKPSPSTEDSKSLAKEPKKADGSKSEGVKGDKGKEKSEGVKGEKGKEKGEGVKADKGKEKAEGVKGEKGKEKSEGVKGDKGKEKAEGVKGEKGKEKSEGAKSDGVKGDKEKEEKSESAKSDDVKGEKKNGSAKSEGVKEKMEDVRRAEDSLAIIDRQRETESQEASKREQKPKKKKVKKTVGLQLGGGGSGGGGGENHWNELFTLPEREGMVGEDAARTTDEKWHPDPQAPFQTPSHLKEAVQEFERSQVPSMGLRPNTIPSDAQPLDHSSEDLEFIYSFFAEIFKTHGPLKPTDSTLIESLALLPEEKKILIAGAGGIERFLLQSSMFCSHEEVICLLEDSPAIAESITHRPSSASSSEPPFPPDERPQDGSSSSTTSESSPRDTPTDSPHIQKKPMDKPATKTVKKTKNKAPKNGSKPSVALAGSSRVDKLDNGSSLTVDNTYETLGPSGPIHRAVQTDRVKMSEHWVLTDPIPISENFKERYEMVLSEKIDLRAKLEESEDLRFKLQRDHKRELDRLSKTLRHDAKEEAQVKIRELEKRVQEEKEKVQQEKKDQTDQLKSHKAEIKSLGDKVERLKKEITKREQQLDNVYLKHQTDLERKSSEHRKVEERLRLSQDNTHLAMQRAISAEVDLLQLRVDNVMRPGEARLTEIDRICNHLPQNSALQREWLAYQEKLKTALECFKIATEEQIQAVKSGRELSSMEKVPNPSVPLPAHLAFRGVPMMRPPFPPAPMRMPMRGPPVPMGLRPADPSIGYPAPTGVPGTHPGVMPHPMQAPPPHSMEAPVTVAAALPQREGGPEPPPTSHAPAVASGGISEGEHRTSKSSFDRIVEKLVPHYPAYSRDDFKMILREVRRNNQNTLSGLSLDSIAEQVRSIIEAKERAKGGGAETKVKPRPQLPPVAQAPPPVHTSTEYTDEWSCVICYEDMDASDSSRLVCGHRFHTECIKSWFKEQNTCPTCRNYALLPDEYPFLGH